MKWLLVALITALVLLHQDTWLWRDHTLVLDFLPIGLVYHMGYCVAASLAMWALVRYAWPHAKDEEANQRLKDEGDPEHLNTRTPEHPCEGRTANQRLKDERDAEHPNTRTPEHPNPPTPEHPTPETAP